MGNSSSCIGTEFKISVSMEPIEGQTLSELDFNAEVYTDRSGKGKKYEKADCIKLDNDTYVVPVDSSEIGAGRYFIKVTVFIPDTHFLDGYRKDVSTFYSGKEILP